MTILMQLIFLRYLISFFFPVVIVFLTLTHGRFDERNPNDGGMGYALSDGIVESIHVLGEEALADEA